MTENPHSKTRRRRFGVVCISIAILLLIAGETALKSWLAESALILVCYWMSCFLLTALAAFIAIVDAARVGWSSREEQRSLLEETLQQVVREKQERKKPKR